MRFLNLARTLGVIYFVLGLLMFNLSFIGITGAVIGSSSINPIFSIMGVGLLIIGIWLLSSRRFYDYYNT